MFVIRVEATGLFWNGDEFQNSYREARRYKTKDSAKCTVRKIKKDLPYYAEGIKIQPEFGVIVYQGEAVRN